jgi:hypothetical protein
MEFVDIDEATAEMIAKVASTLFKHDYPLCDDHIKASYVKYVYRAAMIYKKALESNNG